MRILPAFVLFFFLCSPITLIAGEADIVDVKIRKNGDSVYDFWVTVFHEDTGWDHYADRWEILDEKGRILATRILQHPHVNEQPFTRGLSGVKIDNSIKSVLIRARDSVHQYGGKALKVKLPE